MGRVRIALATAVALFLLAAPAPAKYRPTHQIVVTGQFVNHWTIDDPDFCGPVGSGTTTVDFRSLTPNRAAPIVSSSANRWVLQALNGRFLSEMDSKAATATIDRQDETQPRPWPFVDDDHDGIADTPPCPPPDRNGCGTRPLKRQFVSVAGVDRTHIEFNLEGAQWRELPCRLGSLDLFFSPPSLAGGTREGHIRIRMPRESKLRRQKVVTVSGSSHKKTSSGDPGQTAYTDDVTRTVTVTFTRIAR